MNKAELLHDIANQMLNSPDRRPYLFSSIRTEMFNPFETVSIRNFYTVLTDLNELLSRNSNEFSAIPDSVWIRLFIQCGFFFGLVYDDKHAPYNFSEFCVLSYQISNRVDEGIDSIIEPQERGYPFHECKIYPTTMRIIEEIEQEREEIASHIPSDLYCALRASELTEQTRNSVGLDLPDELLELSPDIDYDRVVWA